RTTAACPLCLHDALPILEDFRVDVVVGKGVGATSIPLELPPFTVVGATTRAGLLPAPLRDRFGFVGHLDYYRASELHEVVTRSRSEEHTSELQSRENLVC